MAYADMEVNGLTIRRIFSRDQNIPIGTISGFYDPERQMLNGVIDHGRNDRLAYLRAGDRSKVQFTEERCGAYVIRKYEGIYYAGMPTETNALQSMGYYTRRLEAMMACGYKPLEQVTAPKSSYPQNKPGYRAEKLVGKGDSK